jgi:hypothetical protein
MIVAMNVAESVTKMKAIPKLTHQNGEQPSQLAMALVNA